MSVWKRMSCSHPNCTRIMENTFSWNQTEEEPPSSAATVGVMPGMSHAFPTVDVPDHAHYTIGAIILIIGITGIVGNFLVIYAFSRSRSLRTPPNMFIINLAITDFLMCVTQSPVFFITSMHKRWIFGEKGCELYAFCGALFGICSMITLMVIAVDRYFVITQPLASIGMLSCRRAVLVLLGAWLYSLAWSLPPFFGWSAYVPEGLLTSCSWDYMTFSPSVRAYTMLLFVFVFFIPLGVIMYCYFFIFRSIRITGKAVDSITGSNCKDFIRRFHRLRNEWKTAKIALIVILLYVISWSPYSTVALTAFAGYAHILTPYMNSIPALIAKASAIHNPIIYAITHPKYRVAIAKYFPCLRALLCIQPKDFQFNSSFASTRRSTVTSQSSESGSHPGRGGKCRLSSGSDSESGWTDTEADLSSVSSRPASRQVSCDVRRDVEDVPGFKTAEFLKPKLRSQDSGIFEKTSVDADDVSLNNTGLSDLNSPGAVFEDPECRSNISWLPNIIITSESRSALTPVLRSSIRGLHCRGAGPAGSMLGVGLAGSVLGAGPAGSVPGAGPAGSLLRAGSAGSMLGVGLAGSVLGARPAGSVLGAGPAGSMLGVGLAGSVLGAGPAGSVLGVGLAGSVLGAGPAGSVPGAGRTGSMMGAGPVGCVPGAELALTEAIEADPRQSLSPPAGVEST